MAMVTTSVFEKNIKAYNSGASLIVNQGGTRSSKTYSILQLLVLIALKSKTALIISVVSRALPHLRLGAMRDIDNILLSLGIIPDHVKNKTENSYRLGKSLIEFFGADQLDKVHGPARDILFLNECNYIKYDVFDHLAIRTSKVVIIDFNPSRSFWFHDEIQGKQKFAFIKSTYLDNEHLTPQQVERIEAKKTNQYWWQVYGLGEL